MQEFTDFLAKQPPFDALPTDDIERLASKVEVEYFGLGTVIVTAGSEPLDHIYMVRTGSVEVLDRGNLVDLLGPGDAFGHISLLTGLPPQFSVRAAEDTLCYRLPDPRSIVQDASALAFNHFGTLVTRHRLTASALMSDAQSNVVRYMRTIIWCDASASVREVAKDITDSDQSCALIRSGDELGLVTDRDFRSRVGVGEVSIDAPVRAIMSTPIITVPKTTTLAAAFLLMVEAGVHHLVVIDEYEKPIGIVRAMDLASVELRNPLLIRGAIESAHNIEELSSASRLLLPSLVELHDSGIPALHVGGLMSAIVGAILVRLLKLSDSIESPVAHSWLMLGSMARGEPLPISDVDTAIVWADLADSIDPAEEIQRNAKQILDQMELCGLHRCPNGANADNLLFTRSKSSWIEVSSGWLTDPTRAGALLLSSIAADSQPLTQLALGRTITDTIRATTRSNEFLGALLRFTLAKKPPIGFVRGFVVDQSGEHRGDLDLKAGGLTPICALARWLAIAQGDVRGSTIDRLKRAASAGLLRDEEADILINAFKDIYQLVFEAEIAAIRGGREGSSWISPQNLDSLTRRHLRESFRAVSAIQTRFHNEWETRLG
ncbi:MAG: putative nucleotidyltransferase substrate binding domain-containing protein [Candidatus Planktophila sp.]|nr:putative nucleotidyltransferase substrate binding domain-containing protein [Candidatus Planktophila sp.]